MARFALLQDATGLRYDAINKTLHVSDRTDDFKSPLFTAIGYATVERKNGKVTVHLRAGEIPIIRIMRQLVSNASGGLEKLGSKEKK